MKNIKHDHGDPWQDWLVRCGATLTPALYREGQELLRKAKEEAEQRGYIAGGKAERERLENAITKAEQEELGFIAEHPIDNSHDRTARSSVGRVIATSLSAMKGVL